MSDKQVRLDIPESQMNQLIMAAIVDAIGTEERDAMIQKAIETLFVKKTDRYGHTDRDATSRIQDIFETAMHKQATEAAVELLALPAYQLKLKNVIREAFDLLIEAGSEDVSNGVALSIATALSSSLRRKYDE
jgi:hypothetical protein